MTTSRRGRTLVAGMVLATALFAVGPGVQAQEGDAKSILKAMADYVSGQNTIELTLASAGSPDFTDHFLA